MFEPLPLCLRFLLEASLLILCFLWITNQPNNAVSRIFSTSLVTYRMKFNPTPGTQGPFVMQILLSCLCSTLAIKGLVFAPSRVSLRPLTERQTTLRQVIESTCRFLHLEYAVSAASSSVKLCPESHGTPGVLSYAWVVCFVEPTFPSHPPRRGSLVVCNLFTQWEDSPLESELLQDGMYFLFPLSSWCSLKWSLAHSRCSKCLLNERRDLTK